MLPMQRITRLPLLVGAILSQMDSTDNSLEYQMCELTLASLNSVSFSFKCLVFLKLKPVYINNINYIIIIFCILDSPKLQ